MADTGQRTEQPTPRRLEKARKEGQFPVSREFVAAIQFGLFVAIAGAYGGDALSGILRLLRRLMEAAFVRRELTSLECRRLFLVIAQGSFIPLLYAGAGLAAATAGAHLAVTRLGFAPSHLTPDLTRLSPLKKIKEVWRQNIPLFFQALLLLPVFGAVTYFALTANVALFLRLPFLAVAGGVRQVAGSLDSFLWKAAVAIFIWGTVDLVRQQRRFHMDLRMSKHEVRDEAKEAQGDPQVKSRVRRMMREVLRRRMMQQVPKATAVVVNPTHYAVAIRYHIESMAAPVVVAKGKNYLALRIRMVAIAHQIPIIENPPLAQALYQSADVGQQIPVTLYRAVAEILAYIFKLRNRK
jgi:flagellar biosynthetic protein FlhB